MDTVPVRWKDKSYAFFNHMIPWSEHCWVLSSRWNGLWLLDCRTGEIERPTFCKEKEIMSVKVDTQGDLWISPYGKGLDRYIDGGRKQKHYDVSNSDLTNNVILDIEERDGSLWLATDGGGISILNLKDETFPIFDIRPAISIHFRIVRYFVYIRTGTTICGPERYEVDYSASKRYI